MPDEKKCPFCDVDPLRNRILDEREGLILTLSNPRLMKGHLLVIPRRHVGALYALEYSERADILNYALNLQEELIRVFAKEWGRPAGCDVSWHTRPFMPETERNVPGHAHIHLRPRFLDDPLYDRVQRHETPMFERISPEEIAANAALLGQISFSEL